MIFVNRPTGRFTLRTGSAGSKGSAHAQVSFVEVAPESVGAGPASAGPAPTASNSKQSAPRQNVRHLPRRINLPRLMHHQKTIPLHHGPNIPRTFPVNRLHHRLALRPTNSRRQKMRER